MKNEDLTLDYFIKGLRNLGVKSISLELMPHQSLSCSTSFDNPNIPGHLIANSAGTEGAQKVQDLADKSKTINANVQDVIDKDGGVLVGEKPVALKKPAPKSKPVATKVKETKPVDQFERFAHLVEHDDGKENAAEKKAIVNKLKLDDLLRINNEFSCGVDTDCKIGELRTTILSLF